jgi:hypothetical protein
MPCYAVLCRTAACSAVLCRISADTTDRTAGIVDLRCGELISRDYDLRLFECGVREPGSVLVGGSTGVDSCTG